MSLEGGCDHGMICSGRKLLSNSGEIDLNGLMGLFSNVNDFDFFVIDSASFSRSEVFTRVMDTPSLDNHYISVKGESDLGSSYLVYVENRGVQNA